MTKLMPPRDPKMLLTEMSARIKIKDIEHLYTLRERVAVKWYESGLVSLLFVAALAFLVIVIQLLPNPNVVVWYFLVGSSVGLILIVTAILEFLLMKFRAMRQLYEHQSRLIEDLEKELVRLRTDLAEIAPPSLEGDDDAARE